MGHAREDVSALVRLRELLGTHSPGPVSQARAEVLGLLRSAWPFLEGGGAEGMHAGKLGEQRVEDLRWDPPVLRFRIERHGGTACGSTRADLQLWTVDLERATVTSAITGHRQIRAMEPRYTAGDIERAVQRVLDLLDAGKDDDCLKWSRDRCRVRVILRLIVPQSFLRTTRGRNRRFSARLAAALQEKGWKDVGLHAFARPEPTDAGGDGNGG